MKKRKLWLLVILFLALFLRLYKLNQLELFGDELDVGYHAYSLWLTGRDYMGQKLPVYIHSFSEWRAPLLMYVTAPSVGILGLNSWGVRLPAVIFGILDIWLLYLLVEILSKDKTLAILAALILAITPWHIHYSRAAFEVTLFLFLTLLGTLAAIKGAAGKINGKWLWLAALSFALTFYTYNTANVFIPLWILALFLVYRRRIFIQTKKFLLPSLAFLLLVLPLMLVTLRGQAAARFELIGIFNNPKTIDKIVFKRNTGLSPAVERIYHNKLLGWNKEFVNNYLTAFSPQFLFLTGDPNPRHNLPMFGEFYWILAPFLVLGFIQLFVQKKSPFKILTFSWLLLAPIPSSLTISGGNQATRLFLMLPPLVILIALGIKKVMKFKVVFYATGVALLISLVFWLHNYSVHYPKEQYRYWHYGYQESMSWLDGRENHYKRIIINERHEPALIRYLFWTHKPPHWLWNNFHNDRLAKNILPGLDGFTLGKVVFGIINADDKQGWLEKNLQSGDLYLAFQQDEVPGDWNWAKSPPDKLDVLKTVYTPWGKPMMYWIIKK